MKRKQLDGEETRSVSPLLARFALSRRHSARNDELLGPLRQKLLHEDGTV